MRRCVDRRRQQNSASDFEPEEFEPEGSDLEEPKAELEKSEPKESEIQTPMRAEQEKFEIRLRTEQEMTYMVFHELRFEPGE